MFIKTYLDAKERGRHERSPFMERPNVKSPKLSHRGVRVGPDRQNMALDKVARSSIKLAELVELLSK